MKFTTLMFSRNIYASLTGWKDHPGLVQLITLFWRCFNVAFCKKSPMWCYTAPLIVSPGDKLIKARQPSRWKTESKLGGQKSTKEDLMFGCLVPSCPSPSIRRRTTSFRKILKISIFRQSCNQSAKLAIFQRSAWFLFWSCNAAPLGEMQRSEIFGPICDVLLSSFVK